MLYSCTHMAALGVKGLICTMQLTFSVIFKVFRDVCGKGVPEKHFNFNDLA